MTETPPVAHKPELGFREELAWFWSRWPSKGLWLALAVAWVLLFQFLGNSTFGYIDTHSLFRWMHYAYTHAPDDEHGFLIPLVVLGLLWWKRRELLAAVEGVWWPALILVGVALGVHFVAYLVQQTRISIFAFYLGLYALTGLVWGRRFLVASFFPMILFVFAVPLSTVSEAITYPLRIMVTKIAVGIGHNVLAMSVGRDGSQIVQFVGGRAIPMYDVAPACSGIRSLTALGAITMIYAFAGFRTHWRRLAILLSAIPLAVAGNVARVTTVMVLGDVIGKEQAMRMEQNLGLVTFVVALSCLFLLGRWLKEQEAPAPESQLEHLPAHPAFLGARAWSCLAVVLILLAGTSAVLARVGGGQRLGKPGLKIVAEPTMIDNGEVAQTNSVFLPPTVLDYTSWTTNISTIEFNWLPKDTLYGRRIYHSPNAPVANYVQASVVLMGTDRTSIHKPQYCLDGQGWRIEKTETAVVSVQEPHPYDLRVMKLTSTKNVEGRTWRGIYVYWFVAENELTPYHGERMWLMARDLIRSGVLQRWAYVSYFTVCLPGFEDAAFNRLKEMITASVPQFQLAAGPKRPTTATAAAAIASGDNSHQ